MTTEDLTRLDAVLAGGGVAIVPTDTVYGLACALDVDGAVENMYAVKGRDRGKPCQVLAYGADLFADVVDGLDATTRSVVSAVLPGSVTCIIADPTGRYAAASGDARGSVGLRVPRMAPEFTAIRRLLVATSANAPGGPSPARVEEIPEDIRARVDHIVDIGPLPGTASTVLDLTDVAKGVGIIRTGPEIDNLFSVLEKLRVRIRR